MRHLEVYSEYDGRARYRRSRDELSLYMPSFHGQQPSKPSARMISPAAMFSTRLPYCDCTDALMKPCQDRNRGCQRRT